MTGPLVLDLVIGLALGLSQMQSLSLSLGHDLKTAHQWHRLRSVSGDGLLVNPGEAGGGCIAHLSPVPHSLYHF